MKSFDPLDKPTSFMLVKYFPLAFMVTFENPLSDPITSLNSILSSKPDQERDIYVNLKNMPAADFPEAPSSSNIVLYGDAAMKALPM